MGCKLLDTKARLMSISEGDKGEQLPGTGEGGGCTGVRGSAELTKQTGKKVRKEARHEQSWDLC